MYMEQKKQFFKALIKCIETVKIKYMGESLQPFFLGQKQGLFRLNVYFEKGHSIQGAPKVREFLMKCLFLEVKVNNLCWQCSGFLTRRILKAKNVTFFGVNFEICLKTKRV